MTNCLSLGHFDFAAKWGADFLGVVKGRGCQKAWEPSIQKVKNHCSIGCDLELKQLRLCSDIHGCCISFKDLDLLGFKI